LSRNQSGGTPGIEIKVWVMNQQTSPIVASVPPAFLNRFGDSITGVLSGFDRRRLRGTLRQLFQPTVMEACLNACRVLIKDFGTFAQGLTTRIKAAAYATAEQAGRPSAICLTARPARKISPAGLPAKTASPPV
jgi:hypothetical protein